MRRAAKYCDGWVPYGARPTPTSGGRTILEPDQMEAAVARMRRMTVQAGRPEDAVEIVMLCNMVFDDAAGPDRGRLTGSTDQILEDIQKYLDAGVQSFLAGFSARSPTEQVELAERFSREVMPHFQ